MPKIFISHAWEDNEISRKLARRLKRDGAEVYIYFSQIEVGNHLPAVFSDAIEWCDIFILLWSIAASTSQGVELEWQKAWNLKKAIITGLLDDTKQSTTLGGFFFVKLNEFDHGYDNLAHLLNLNLFRESQTADLPEETLIEPKSTVTVIRLREQPENLAETDVETMIKKYDFFDLKRNAKGLSINREFELLDINDDQVVFDPSTRLIWQHSGSSISMWYEETKEWIKKLNQSGYAGFNDWRLPTLEEAMSLMNHENKSNGLYLDPMFDHKQMNIWTSDLSENASRGWVVFFNYGSCHLNYLDFNNFIRAVRPMKDD